MVEEDKAELQLAKFNNLKILLKSEPKVVSFIQRVLTLRKQYDKKEIIKDFSTEMLNYL
jgi:hypothetical protein